MDTRILVPLDGSPLAETALPDALAIAHRRGCGLLLLHVVTPDAIERSYRFHDAADQAVAYADQCRERGVGIGIQDSGFRIQDSTYKLRRYHGLSPALQRQS